MLVLFTEDENQNTNMLAPSHFYQLWCDTSVIPRQKYSVSPFETHFICIVHENNNLLSIHTNMICSNTEIKFLYEIHNPYTVERRLSTLNKVVWLIKHFGYLNMHKSTQLITAVKPKVSWYDTCSSANPTDWTKAQRVLRTFMTVFQDLNSFGPKSINYFFF